MRIGLDLDGVVYDVMTPWLKRYNERYGDNMTRSDITDFDFEGVDFKCTKEEFMSFLYDGRMHLDAKPIAGAVEAITMMADAGHTIVFITSTKRPAIWAKAARLMTDFFDTPYEIHFTSEKEHVMVDVFVDDHIGNLERVWRYNAKRGKVGPDLFLFDQPWNVKYGDRFFARVMGWSSILEEVGCGKTT